MTDLGLTLVATSKCNVPRVKNCIDIRLFVNKWPKNTLKLFFAYIFGVKFGRFRKLALNLLHSQLDCNY